MTDWTPELADDDLDTLMDALEAWESKDLSGEIMGSMFDSLFTSKAGPMPANIVADRAREQRERESAKRLRKERSVLLRAKLLMIRDRRCAEHMMHDALR